MAAADPLNPRNAGDKGDERPAGPPQASSAPSGGSEPHEAGSLGAERRAGPPQASSAPSGGSEPHEVGRVGAISIEKKLQQAGLELLGNCQRMSGRGPDLLEHSTMLEDFTPQELDTLGEAMLLIRAQPGQVLISEGDVGDWMLLLLSGTVDVTKATPPGGDETESTESFSRLAVATDGAALGEMSMFDRDMRYATCTAIDTVEAAVLTRAAIGRLIHQHPVVGAKLVVKITQLLAQRLRNTSNRMVKMLQTKTV